MGKTLKHQSLEQAIRNKRIMRIGEAIILMNRWQRFWWGLTGRSRYMLNSYWEGARK